MSLRSNKSIGELIRYFRIIKNYSQSTLANELNVTESAISTWERGISRPGVEIAYELAKMMKINLNQFFFVETDTNESQNFSIYKAIKFSRSYIDLTDIVIEENGTRLTVDFTIRGMTVDDHYIDHVFGMKLSHDGTHYFAPDNLTVIEKTKYRSDMSPEFEEVPLNASLFKLSATFTIEGLKDYVLEFNQNGEKAWFEMNESLFKILNKEIKIKIDGADNEQDYVQDDLITILLFLGKNRNHQALKQFFYL